MAATERISYKFPPPHILVNHIVKGLVSHMDCFWLQMEMDKVARLTLCMNK